MQHIKSLATELVQLRDLKPGDKVLWDDRKWREVTAIDGQLGRYELMFKESIKAEVIYEPKLCKRVRK